MDLLSFNRHSAGEAKDTASRRLLEAHEALQSLELPYYPG